jgi:hypothetical protein
VSVLHRLRLRRLLRFLLTGAVGAAFGLWVGAEVYSGLIPPATDPPTTAERFPWLAHPLYTPLVFGTVSVLLLLLIESLAVRQRKR